MDRQTQSGRQTDDRQTIRLTNRWTGRQTVSDKTSGQPYRHIIFVEPSGIYRKTLIQNNIVQYSRKEDCFYYILGISFGFF